MPKNEYMCDCNIVHQEHVIKAKENIPSDELINKVSNFHKLIGDQTRCKMLFALLNGELCVCDLANVLSMSKSSISHQLAKMKEYGLVKSRKAGKEVYYTLEDNHVSEIFKVSLVHMIHKREGEK